MTLSGGQSSTTAMGESTETDQFKQAANDPMKTAAE